MREILTSCFQGGQGWDRLSSRSSFEKCVRCACADIHNLLVRRARWVFAVYFTGRQGFATAYGG